MSKKIIALGVAGIVLAAGTLKSWLNNQEWFRQIDLGDITLTQPDLKPGAWFCYYLGDYMTQHPGENVVSSSPVELRDGTFMWATNTPEWDRGWFGLRGHEFPNRWMPYNDLAGLPMERIGG